MRTWHDQPGFLHGEGGGVINAFKHSFSAAGRKSAKKSVWVVLVSVLVGQRPLVAVMIKGAGSRKSGRPVGGPKAAKCL